ncbi:MAG: hypothetical protein ACHQM6_07685 [Candidatus Kapaibacterium sp.]
MSVSRLFIFLICFLLPLGVQAQEKKLIHKARTTVIIPGLRRELDAELANISIEVNPGWQTEEIDNAKDHIYQLIFTDPEDSAKKFLSLLVDHYDSKDFDSTKWEGLRKSIRISYGDRGIAVRPLMEKMNDKATFDSSGILAYYEILTRHPDHIEYVDAIVGKTSLLLLSAPLKTEEYQQKIPYFRDIAGSIRLGKSK